jgi:hypothetical protein
VSFVIFILVIVGVLLLFPGKKYPPMPDDQVHRAAKDEKACMECHGPGKKDAMKKSHPPKFECFKCHERSGRS